MTQSASQRTTEAIAEGPLLRRYEEEEEAPSAAVDGPLLALVLFGDVEREERTRLVLFRRSSAGCGSSSAAAVDSFFSDCCWDC